MSEDRTEKLPSKGNDEILTAIKAMDTHVTKIDSRLQSLEKKVDERLHDTRPIWHKVVADIGELQSGQKRLEEGQKHLEDGQKHLRDGQQAMREEIGELNNTVRQVNRDQLVINDSVRRMQMDFHTINEKLHKLTVNRNQQNSST